MCRAADTLAREQRGKQSALCSASCVHAFGLRCIVDETPQAAAEASCMAECGGGLHGLEPEQACARSGRAKHAAGHGGMPSGVVVRRVSAARFEHAAPDVVS